MPRRAVDEMSVLALNKTVRRIEEGKESRVGSALVGSVGWFNVRMRKYALGDAISASSVLRRTHEGRRRDDDYNGQLGLYAILLAAIFSIYFDTIGIILSTGYAKLNRKIVSLLISEQVGKLYTSTLIFATAFCLTVTAINIFGYQTGLAVYVVSSCLTVLLSDVSAYGTI